MRQKPTIPPLEPEALQLLPAADTHPRCSPFAQSLGLDPGGTAIPAQRIIVVGTPLPWPKPVFDHRLLSKVTPKFSGPDGPVRVLASVPPADGSLTIRTFFRRGAETVRVDHAISAHVTSDQLGALVDTLSSHVNPEDVPGGRSGDPSAILICTQGSHDVCCGTEGARLAGELEGDDALRDTEILRVSHTGGHRFAPTALTFPSGRMWAYVDRNQLVQIMRETGSPNDVADLCRGWWGASSPAAQVAERAVFATQSWDWDRTQRSLAEEPLPHLQPGRTGMVGVTENGVTLQVEVTVVRQVPSITCRAQGGLPAKRGWELTATVIG